MPLSKVKLLDEGEVVEVEPIRSIRSLKDYNKVTVEYEIERLKLERLKNNDKVTDEAVENQKALTVRYQAAVLKGVRGKNFMKKQNGRKAMAKASRKANRGTKGKSRKR